MHAGGIISLVKGDKNARNEYLPLAVVTAEYRQRLLAGVTEVLKP